MTSQPLTPEQLAEIAARAEAATPGPWCTDSWEIYQGTEYVPGVSQWIGETCRGNTTCEQDRADATFVAAARTDIPTLIAEIQRLTAERDAFRDQRNAVFATTEQLLAKVDELGQARLRAENETRTVKREYAEAAATVAELVQKRGERMKVENALRDEVEELRTRVAELETERTTLLGVLSDTVEQARDDHDFITQMETRKHEDEETGR